MVLFKDLFWKKWAKFLEGGRLKSEKVKRDFEETLALREQYMLGLLMPIRGKEFFKVVVRDPFNFDYFMVRELLHRISSPTKYYKYYKSGDVYILEGFTDDEEYKSYKKENIVQTAFLFLFFIFMFVTLFIFQWSIVEMRNVLLSWLYLCVAVGVALWGVLFPFYLINRRFKNEDTIGYGKL